MRTAPTLDTKKKNVYMTQKINHTTSVPVRVVSTVLRPTFSTFHGSGRPCRLHRQRAFSCHACFYRRYKRVFQLEFHLCPAGKILHRRQFPRRRANLTYSPEQIVRMQEPWPSPTHSSPLILRGPEINISLFASFLHHSRRSHFPNERSAT